MNSSAAEARRLTHRVQSGDWFAVSGAQDAALKIGLDAAEALAGKNELPDRNQGAGARIEDSLEIAAGGARRKPIQGPG